MAASSSVRKARGARRNPGHISVRKMATPIGQRNRQQQRQKRGDQRAVDERQGAEVAVDRVPVGRKAGRGVEVGLAEELKAESVPGEMGTLAPTPMAMSATMPKMLSAHSTMRTRKTPSAMAEFPRASRKRRIAECSSRPRPLRPAAGRCGTRVEAGAGRCEFRARWRPQKIRLPGKYEQEVTRKQNQVHTGGNRGGCGGRARTEAEWGQPEANGTAGKRAWTAGTSTGNAPYGRRQAKPRKID